MRRSTTAFALIATAILSACGQAPVAPAVRKAAPPVAALAAAPEAEAFERDEAPAVAAPRFQAAADPAGTALSLLTFNTWGKPGIFGTKLETRFGLIGEAVKGHDVVAMQETFTGRAADLGEAAGYEHFLRPTKGGFLKTNPGLTLMARHPMRETDFVAFSKATGGDRFARKGVLFARLDVPGAGAVDVYTTHFQSMADPKAEAIRLHDVDVLAAFVAKHAAGHPTLIMGDFNMRPDSAPYAALKAKLPVRDAWAEAHPDDPGYTSGPEIPYKKKTSPHKRIDFVFVMGAVRVDAAEVVFEEPVDGTVLSDHYGVHAEVTVNPGP